MADNIIHNDVVKDALKKLYTKISVNKLCVVTEQSAKLIDNTLILIDNYEKEIERLSHCVKSEDDVRRIMKSELETTVKEMMDNELNSIEQSYIKAMDSVKGAVAEQFGRRLMNIIGDNGGSIEKSLVKVAVMYLINDYKNGSENSESIKN